MHEEMIQTAIEGVAVGDRKVLAEQIAHRTVVVPVPVQAPFATRVDETVSNQGLEHIQPARPLAAGRQPRLPEGVQLQQVPQPTRQPARAPLARAAQLQSAQLDLDHRAGQFRRLAVLREQGHLRRRAAVLIKDLNGLAPGRPLGVVDLPQIQHVTLHHPPVGHTTVLHHTPVAVLFAVLLARLGSQEHADSVGRNATRLKEQGRHYRRSRETQPRAINKLPCPRRPKWPEIGGIPGE